MESTIITQESTPLATAPAEAATPVTPRGVVLGEVLSVDADGRIWLRLPWPGTQPVCASCCLCLPTDLSPGCRVAFRPVCAFVNPAFDEFDLFGLERFAAFRHAVFAAFAQQALDKARVLAVAGDADAQRELFVIEPQLRHRFLRAMTLRAVGLEDRLNVADEINAGLCRFSLS